MEIGKAYSVPDERLSPKVVDWARKVFEKFGTNEVDSLVVAQLLGHSTVGGAFNAKVALMTGYGVVDRKAGEIRVTETGRMIVSPKSSKEKMEGVRASLFKIGLWERIYRDYTSKGAKLPADFAAELAKIAGIAPAEAKSKADWVAKAYEVDISYLKSVERETETEGPVGFPKSAAVHVELPTVSATALDQTGPGLSVGSGQIVFYSQDDRIHLSVPRSAKHIGMLRTFIESALKVIEEELASGSKAEAGRGRAKKQGEK
ncbi:MAG: hypothetical protein LYZ69_03340 [Nitrososphaerales archaeon]|nr:hypothetical protein [Nitrososphaerales archaeon]